MGGGGTERDYLAASIARVLVFALIVAVGVELEAKSSQSNALRIALVVDALGALACAFLAKRLVAAIGVRMTFAFVAYVSAAVTSLAASVCVADQDFGVQLVTYPTVLAAGTVSIVASATFAWVVDGRDRVRTIIVPLVPGSLAVAVYSLYGVVLVLGGAGGGHYSVDARRAIDRFLYVGLAFWIVHAVLHVAIVRAAMRRRMSA